MKGDELEEVDILSSEDERQIKENVEAENSDSEMVDDDSSSDASDSDISVQKEIKKKGKQVTK